MHVSRWLNDPTRRPRGRLASSWLLRAGVGVLVAAVALVGWGAEASAQVGREQIRSYLVDVVVERDGDITVVEQIDYDFGNDERHGIFRDIPTRLRYDDRYDRVYRLHDIKVTGDPKTPTKYETEDLPGGLTRIKIGDADKTISGRHIYRIEYRVEGALNAFPDHDELYWNAIGQDWDAPIGGTAVTVQFEAGGNIDAPQTACFAGPRGSQLACRSSRVEGGRAAFEGGALDAREGMTVVVGFPKGVVPEPAPILDERWSFRRAFTVDPLRLVIAGVVLVAAVGGVARLYWLNGRDWRWRGSATEAVFGSNAGTQRVPWGDGEVFAAEYTPVDDLRPGQIGTLIDETAHPLDVSATIVDLAARGHLLIEEVPKEGWFGSADWRLTKQAQGTDKRTLLDYEQLLLDGLFEDGDEVLLSDLKTKFATRLKQVQDALYADVIARGWFVGSPSSVRAQWVGIGIGALVIAIGVLLLVAKTTTFGIVALPPIVGALGLLAISGQMPRRSAQGTAVLRRTLGFRRFIEDAETHRSEFAEKAGLFYEYLPYAIVFGCVDRWVKAFEGLAMTPPSWYGSPGAFHAAAFAHSMSGFSDTTTSTLASTPGGSGSSGFGGSSGGGGGGGGGGSW
jgi:uncharacterized membrane protein YgcG